ncbi:hypothetical protein ACFFGH_26110 [Lysobacter korlensis]|uniref:DNA polymerase III subunit gamma/tau n=1 Tax=Lysobacter korlensis TaxID=553636 RepID=A0ABV6RWG5_9GAMM
MATEPEEPNPGATPADPKRDASADAAKPDATRRFDPVVPDADADDSTVRLGHPADEEALRWDGDDPTERLVPAGSTVPARGKRGGGAASGSALLIIYGAFGGIFLLMTIGWIATALRYEPTTDDPLGGFMQRVSTLLAIASPGMWFGIAFWLTRGRPPWQRIVWLVLGMLLVAPWPLITGSLG